MFPLRGKDGHAKLTYMILVPASRLEHCCWDHIDQSCFEHHHHHHPSQDQQHPPAPCANPGLNGHALMATALVLQTAPFDVFARINDLQQQLSASTSPSSHPTTTTTTTRTTAAAVAAPSPAAGPQLAWSSRALTLTNLRRLAGTLNASDSELAPVQAWFELASLYGAAVATDAAVLEELKRELSAEVHCVMFGAAVQRDVFEAALEKVVGFLPRTWRSAAGIAEAEEQEQEQEEEQEEGEGEGEGGMMDFGDEETEEEMVMLMGMGMGTGTETDWDEGGTRARNEVRMGVD